MASLRLIVGLANPGPQYAETRHNAGAWYVERLAQRHQIPLSEDKKMFGFTGRGLIGGRDVRLLIPTTFMNRSGQAIGTLATFYKILPDEILVAHDELDIPPGTLKVKTGGGHGGHNGLRDAIRALANQNGFHRLRVGIGHPGDKKLVTNYVLGKAPASEQRLIEGALDEAVRETEALVAGDFATAMQRLHSLKPQVS